MLTMPTTFFPWAFEPDTGVITNTGTTQTQIRAQFQKDSAQGIAFDSSRGSFSIALGSVVSNRFKNANFSGHPQFGFIDTVLFF